MTTLTNWPRSPTVRASVVLAVLGIGLWYFARVDRAFALDTDDAYITYRYAQNLADGAGFVYNPGERVMGTTTPLLTLILAVLAKAGVPIPDASAGIGVVSAALVLTIVVVWLFRLTGSTVAALLGGLLILSLPKFVLFAVSGMETSLYVLAIISSFALYDYGRLSAAAVVAAMAALVRLDGLAVGGALLLHFAASRRRLPPLRVLAAYVLPLLPWFIFAWLYFGSVLPQSMLAKHQHVMTASRWWMLAFCAGPEALPFWPLALAGFLPPLVRRTATPAGLHALAIWTAVYIAAYSVYRIDLYLWYLSPLAAALAFLAAVGVARIFRLGEATERVPRAGLRWNAAGCALVMAPLLIVGGWQTADAVKAMVGWTDTVERARADAAAQIRREGQPGDVIATGAIGIVGWTTRAPVFDTMALVTPAAVAVKGTESLRQSRATWYITETNERNAPAPSVPDFALVGAFNRDWPPTFLLYRRTAALAAGTQKRASLRFVSGLTIESVALRADRLDVVMSVDRPQERNYKFFVHVHEDGREDGTITRQHDFYPVVATSQMTPGGLFSNSTTIVPALSPSPTIVTLGLFDESNPAFPRLADAEGQDQLIVSLPGP